MKAWLVEKLGDPIDVLEYKDTADPVVHPGMVKVKVLAADPTKPEVLLEVVGHANGH